MDKSSKSIIDHIPHFLEYCQKERHFLLKSVESYNRFLQRFIIWLKQFNLTHLSPEELSLEHIQEYKNYLSKQTSSETNQYITKKTQNYYLIALRALLSYFAEKDIPSLLQDKIQLLKEDKSSGKNKFLNLEHLGKLLNAPKTSTIIGLRDKAILETLFSTGLKVTQLVSLNRDQIKIEMNTKNLEIKILDKGKVHSRSVYLSERAVDSLRKYLQARKDNEKALFINYKGPKNASRRLTVRSVEKIVKEYAKRANFPFSLTPEILRTIHILNVLNQEDEIKIAKTPLLHKSLITKSTKSYEFETNKDLLVNSTKSEYIKSSESPTWHVVETVIKKEVNWLKNNIPVLPGSYKKNPPILNCDDCLLRKIAILIVSGKIKATELKAKNGNDLWNNLTRQENLKKITKHGQEWHGKMMDVMSKYFKAQNYEVVFEPTLNYGRADLGIYLNSNKALYIEIGTVSLFKLWYSLSTMKNVTFLIVPSEECVIEFNV